MEWNGNDCVRNEWQCKCGGDLPPSAHSDYTLDVLSLSAWAGWLDGSLFDDDDDVIIVS